MTSCCCRPSHGRLALTWGNACICTDQVISTLSASDRSRHERSKRTVYARSGGCAMLICAAGDIHGAMDGLYQDVFAFEASLRVRFDYVLHVGDFGIWPDPSRIDKATRHHEGVGDFPAWLKENRRAPRPTVFIKGNHDDFVWLA